MPHALGGDATEKAVCLVYPTVHIWCLIASGLHDIPSEAKLKGGGMPCPSNSSYLVLDLPRSVPHGFRSNGKR